jgi:hypothetical protein
VENFVQPLRLLDADHIKEALVREGGGEQLAGGQGHRLCTDVRTWADTQWIEDLTKPLIRQGFVELTCPTPSPLRSYHYRRLTLPFKPSRYAAR